MTASTKRDVEALLREVDAWRGAIVGGGSRFAADIMKDLAAALRAEQERANRLDAEAMTARSLLGIILDRCWPPGTTGPSIARRARAFLADEGQAPQHDDLSGPSEARYAIRCERKRVNDAEEENARLRAELATADEAQTLLRARLAEVERMASTWENGAKHHMTRADLAEGALSKARSEVAQLRADLQFARQQRERLELTIEGLARLVEENAKGRA